MNIKEVRRNSLGRIIVPRGISLAERLAMESAVDPATGCRIWHGNKTPDGYGHINWDGRARYTHCLAWENANGPISEGMKVLHDCPAGDNPSCIDDTHLWLGTDADNRADCVQKGRQAKGEVIAARTRGESSHTSKLTNEQVKAIRTAAGSQRLIARQFGVCQMTISNIRSRKLWAHLED